MKYNENDLLLQVFRVSTVKFYHRTDKGKMVIVISQDAGDLVFEVTSSGDLNLVEYMP